MLPRETIQAPELTSYLIQYLGLRGEYPLTLAPEIQPVVILGDVTPTSPLVTLNAITPGVVVPVSLEPTSRPLFVTDDPGLDRMPVSGRSSGQPSRYICNLARNAASAPNGFVITPTTTGSPTVTIRIVRLHIYPLTESTTVVSSVLLWLNQPWTFSSSSNVIVSNLDGRSPPISLNSTVIQTGAYGSGGIAGAFGQFNFSQGGLELNFDNFVLYPGQRFAGRLASSNQAMRGTVEIDVWLDSEANET